MPAIDNTPLQILSVNQQPYKGKAGKPDGVMYKAQCVLMVAGVTKIGELFLPRDLVNTEPGFYFGEYVIDSDYSKEVRPMLIGLHPVPPVPASRPARPVDVAKPA